MRAQGSAYVGIGTRIMSNEGRDHAARRGRQLWAARHLRRAPARAKATPSASVIDTKYLHACRENFLIEAAKHGMSKRDIVPNINFFMNVPIDPSGDFTMVDGVSKPGDYVELVAEMDVLCLISNCPQINNPCNGFIPTPIQVVICEAQED